MDNFEYSIQLNDQDWAEFYLASEECSLSQPALATDEEQVLSDIEEGECEEIRLTGWRVDPLLPHDTASCLSHGASSAHLLPEDLLSGSKDETDLGSVSRFLCNDNQSSTAFHPSSGTQESLCVTLKPLESQRGMARPVSENEAVFAAKEGEPETGDWARTPNCALPAVAVPSVQEEHLQEQSPRKEAVERPLQRSLDAPKGMNGTAGENGSDPISLQLQPSQNDASQTASVNTQWLENRGKSTEERLSKRREEALNSKGEKEADRSNSLSCGIIKERDQVGQAESSPCDNVVPLFLEGNQYVRPTQEADSSYDETLAKGRETASLAGMAEKDNGGEPCCNLRMAQPFEKEFNPAIQGGQSYNSGGKSVPFCLTSQGSPETWEERRNRWEGVGEEGPVSYSVPELPSMYGPEMYEYFFADIDEAHMNKDSGGKATAPMTFLSSGPQSAPPSGTEDPNSERAGDATHISIPEVYEHFFENSARDKRNWRAVFISMPASEARKAARALKSFLCRHARHVRSQPTTHGALVRRASQGTLVLLSPRLLDEVHPRPEDLQMAVMEPERPLQAVLTHRDMCLGFVAFASWAVKTSDLQAPDAWKIVLLANFGTLSAIRYFRRAVITEAQHGT